MKTGRRSIFTVAILLISVWAVQLYAQGRGHGHGRGHDRDHEKHDAKEHKHYHHKKEREYRRVEHHHRHTPSSTRHVYHHHHSRHCEHRVVVHHHYERPRYVYYRDYDVYYDHHRHVYISYSGRNWTISASIPVGMRHVNIERVGYAEVEYYDDDFVTYLERGRPIYGRVHASIGY